MALFILLHLSNHLFALFGSEKHLQVMELLRNLYRFPPFEGLLLLAVLTQLFTGLKLVFHKWKNQPAMVRLQVVSGLYLSFFLIVHVGTILIARFSWHIETDIHFATAGLKKYPSLLFFFPYYSCAVIASFLHIATIHYNKSITDYLNGTSPNRISINRQTALIMVAGLLVTVGIMLGLCGYQF